MNYNLFFDEKHINKGSKRNMNNTASTGWELIEREFLRIYPGQNNPLHFAAMIKWRFGGNDPLDGISLYEG